MVEKKIKEMTKEELIRKCVSLQANHSRMKTLYGRQKQQLRNIRIHLQRIKRQIDFLTEHPYSATLHYMPIKRKRKTGEVEG